MNARTTGRPAAADLYDFAANRARRAVLAAAAGVAALVAAPALADVAEQVPSDALMVGKATNLQQVNDEWSALAREWGLDQMEPALGDPLAAFRQETGMGEGVNFDGDVAFYVPAGADFEGDEPPFVILIPISDYQAFLGNFQNLRQEDGMDVADVNPDSGDPAYFMDLGDYAAMTPNGELLAMRGQGGMGFEFSGPTGEKVETADLTFFANMNALGPALQQLLDDEGVKEQVMSEFSDGFDEDAPEAIQAYKPAIEAAIGQYFNVVESFFRDAEAATISVNFEPDAGIGASVVAQFKEGSYLGETFGSLNSSDESLLSGLPEGTYLAFGGGVGDPETGLKLFDDLAGPVLAELNEVDDDGLIMKMVDSFRTGVEATQSNRVGYFAPTGGMGGSPIVQAVNIRTGDPEALMETTKEMAETTPQLMAKVQNLADVPDEQMPDISVNFTEDAKEIGGVSFSRFSTEMPQDNPMQAMFMNMIFGPEGQTQYLAAVDDSLLSVSGLTDDQIADVVRAVEANDDPLAGDAGVAAVNEYLMEERSGVFYIQLGEIARAGLGFAQAFGQAPPVEIPQNLPPIGIASGPGENALKTDLFIHKDLVSAAIVTALQFEDAQRGDNMDGGL